MVVGTKFQVKVTISNFWTKLTQKGHFQSEKEKMKISIEFYMFELV